MDISLPSLHHAIDDVDKPPYHWLDGLFGSSALRKFPVVVPIENTVYRLVFVPSSTDIPWSNPLNNITEGSVSKFVPDVLFGMPEDRLMGQMPAYLASFSVLENLQAVEHIRTLLWSY